MKPNRELSWELLELLFRLSTKQDVLWLPAILLALRNDAPALLLQADEEEGAA